MTAKYTRYSSHPAYGYIRAGRVSGNKECFMSAVTTGSYIIIEIGDAELIIDGEQIKSAPSKGLIRVRLTNHQFAEMITNMHSASGVPCTLEKFDGKKIADLPAAPDYKSVFEENISAILEDVLATIKTVQEKLSSLMSKSNISKKDIAYLQGIVNNLETQLATNIPYMEEASAEMLDNKLAELKAEISAWVQHQLVLNGLSSLKDSIKLIKD